MKKTPSDIVCIVTSGLYGTQYMHGFGSFEYGASCLPAFDYRIDCAMPLTRAQADSLLSKFDFDVRKRCRIVAYPKIDFVSMEDLLDE